MWKINESFKEKFLINKIIRELESSHAAFGRIKGLNNRLIKKEKYRVSK
jgi:hypothetical protein